MNLPANTIDNIYSRLRKQIASVNETTHYHITSNKKYDLVKLVLGQGNKRKALISAGIHGDEPCGVETICSFLEQNKFEPFSQTWELTFLPCLNPYGYEHNTRENHEGNDLNRLFKEVSPSTEIKFAKSVFNKIFDVTIELHEDNMSYGYYLYQTGTQTGTGSLGTKILQTIQPIMDINLNSEIDGYLAKDGIISPKNDLDSVDWWPMALYSLFKGAKNCLTLETAANNPRAQRVQAHLMALDTALNHLS